MDQIEQLGRTLGIILSGILGLKTEGKSAEVFEYSVKSLKEKVDLDILAIVTFTDEKFRKKIIQKGVLNEQGMENLADILFEMGQEIESIQQRNLYFDKAIMLYQYLVDHGETYSIEWNTKLGKIKNERKIHAK
jgi:hypothetical protein